MTDQAAEAVVVVPVGGGDQGGGDQITAEDVADAVSSTAEAVSEAIVDAAEQIGDVIAEAAAAAPPVEAAPVPDGGEPWRREIEDLETRVNGKLDELGKSIVERIEQALEPSTPDPDLETDEATIVSPDVSALDLIQSAEENRPWWKAWL